MTNNQNKTKEYAFVIDKSGRKLAPTNVKTEGRKLYRWQYQKSNRLDENIRKAVILRDDCKCMECGKANCIFEVHHIIPRRLHGANTINNLITLCSNCHQKTEGNEELFISKYQNMINGKNIRFDYA